MKVLEVVQKMYQVAQSVASCWLRAYMSYHPNVAAVRRASALFGACPKVILVALCAKNSRSSQLWIEPAQTAVSSRDAARLLLRGFWTSICGNF